VATAEEVQATISLGSVSEEENEEEEQEIEEEEPPIPPVVTCQGEITTIVGTPGDDRGDNAIVGTEARDVIAALE
jgi:hypothetical protein